MIIENLGNLTLRINGPEAEQYTFLDYNLKNLPYDGTISVHFLAKINFDLTADLVDDKSPYAIIIHNDGEDISTRNLDSFTATVPEDGYYQLTTLVIPTVQYIEDGLGYIPGSIVNDNLNTNIIAAEVQDENTVCFKQLIHTQNPESNYYEHMWVGWEDITISDILITLEQAEESKNLEEVTVKKYQQSIFVIDNLYKCYIEKANNLLNIYTGDKNFCSGDSLCLDSLNSHKFEIQIRDYLWMAINVINYCVQNCQYLKALKVLNCITTCAGICKEVKVKNTNQRSCGCNK